MVFNHYREFKTVLRLPKEGQMLEYLLRSRLFCSCTIVNCNWLFRTAYVAPLKELADPCSLAMHHIAPSSVLYSCRRHYRNAEDHNDSPSLALYQSMLCTPTLHSYPPFGRYSSQGSDRIRSFATVMLQVPSTVKRC